MKNDNLLQELKEQVFIAIAIADADCLVSMTDVETEKYKRKFGKDYDLIIGNFGIKKLTSAPASTREIGTT